MRFTPIHRLGLVAPLLAALCVACGSTPRPGALLEADRLLGDRDAAKKAGEAASGVFSDARAYYRQADAAYDSGDLEEASRLSELATTTFNAAMEAWRTQEASKRLKAALARETAARATQEDEDKRLADLETQISRMEKLSALQGDKAQLAESMQKAQEREALVREAQNLISVAAGKIQVAQALEAEAAAPTLMKTADSTLKAAQVAFKKDDMKGAKTHAIASEKASSEAAAKAREMFSAKKQQMDMLAERKALFDDANAVGASYVRQEERGVVITLHDMFAPGKNTLIAERTPIVDSIAALGNKYTNFPIVVEGYTDARGAQTSNLALSTSRAESVTARLVSEGKLEFNRIKSAGYGESNPVADNSSREGRAKNRRVEVVFLFR